jgi:hypothetical protein
MRCCGGSGGFRDTVKKVTVSEGGVPMVHETLRETASLAQTPQASTAGPSRLAGSVA